jgi:hypothetical protein
MSLGGCGADNPSMTAQTMTRPATLDLHDRRVLLRSWLHTLHGQQVDPRPRTDQPLPALRVLVANAFAWHVAYAIVALVGTIVIGRSSSGSAVAEAVAEGGVAALVTGTLVIWWGGTAFATGLWWAGVQLVRNR